MHFSLSISTHIVGKRIQQYCAECLEITKRTEAGHRSLLTFTQHFSSCLGPCYRMAPHLIATSVQSRYFPVSLGKSQPACKRQIWISNPDLSDVKALTPASKWLKKLSACPEDSHHGWAQECTNDGNKDGRGGKKALMTKTAQVKS